ncbi:MAG TPA: hypothetical protein VIC62_03460, partial [Nakamurella sp.]
MVCVGGTLVATPEGNYFVPEVGFGVGGSVGVDAGPKVTAPEGPEVQGSSSYKFDVGPAQVGASGKVTVPLDNPTPGNVGFEGSVGVANAPGPLKDLSIGGTYSYDKGPAGGIGYEAGPLFGLSEQTKGVVTYPIHLPDTTQTMPADANGVSDVFAQTGAEGPPAMYAVRTLPSGYPDGKGDTVTLNQDGSFTVHTSTADVTTFGPNYLSQQGADQGQGGTLTHQLIDTLGQRTDQYTWQGTDGGMITQTPSGTLTQKNTDGSTIQQSTSGVVTKTNADGSTVSYDPSTGTVTTSDGHWFGTTTTYNQDGSVGQTSPGMSTIWDSSGKGLTTTNAGDGFAFPLTTSDPPPTKPDIPSSIGLPHNPNAPAPAPSDQQNNNPAPSDQQNPAPSDQQNTAPPTAPTDTAPTDQAPAPADTAPADQAPAPAPSDTAPADQAPAPAPTDTAPAPADTTPAPVDSAPAPVDTAPAPVDTAPAP